MIVGNTVFDLLGQKPPVGPIGVVIQKLVHHGNGFIQSVGLNAHRDSAGGSIGLSDRKVHILHTLLQLRLKLILLQKNQIQLVFHLLDSRVTIMISLSQACQ